MKKRPRTARRAAAVQHCRRQTQHRRILGIARPGKAAAGDEVRFGQRERRGRLDEERLIFTPHRRPHHGSSDRQRHRPQRLEDILDARRRPDRIPFTPDAEWIAPARNATAVALAHTDHMIGPRPDRALYRLRDAPPVLRDRYLVSRAMPRRHGDRRRADAGDTSGRRLAARFAIISRIAGIETGFLEKQLFLAVAAGRHDRDEGRSRQISRVLSGDQQALLSGPCIGSFERVNMVRIQIVVALNVLSSCKFGSKTAPDKQTS